MLGRRWHLFTVGGHPIYMDATFLLLLAFFSLNGVDNTTELVTGLMWVPVLFFSVLWHELGHAMATRGFGYGNSMIVLGGLGGVAISEGKVRARPLHAMLISLAGPAASFLLAAVAAGVLYGLEGGFTYTGRGGQLLYLASVANVFWGVFNLLPIYPMDGGQAVQYGLMAALRKRRLAVQITVIVSAITLALALYISVVHMHMRSTMTFLFALYFGWLNWQLWKSVQ